MFPCQLHLKERCSRLCSRAELAEWLSAELTKHRVLGSILGGRITDEAMTGRNAYNAERWYEARLPRLAAMAVTGVTKLF